MYVRHVRMQTCTYDSPRYAFLWTIWAIMDNFTSEKGKNNKNEWNILKITMKEIIIYIIFNSLSNFDLLFSVLLYGLFHSKYENFETFWGAAVLTVDNQWIRVEHVYFVCFSCEVVLPHWAHHNSNIFCSLYFAISLSSYWHRVPGSKLSPILPNKNVKSSMARSAPVENLQPQNVGSITNYLQ